MVLLHVVVVVINMLMAVLVVVTDGCWCWYDLW